MTAAVAHLPPLSPWTDDDADPAPATTEGSATLGVSAQVAYEALADVSQTPRWLSVVRSARVAQSDAEGRPLHVAFLAQLDRATIGYTLSYRWDPGAFAVSWSTPAGASVVVAGEAVFTPLSARACLFHYRLTLHAPFTPDWSASFAGNAAACVVSDFREYLRRLAPPRP